MKQDNILSHLAIIMDGNGRWAKSKGLSRIKGHESGAKKVREITEFVAKTDIKTLTLYAFSTENWQRPKKEVQALMNLLEQYLKSEKQTLLQNNIRFKYIGDIEKFSDNLKHELKSLSEDTKHCTALTQILALNYGAKDELIRAFNKLKGQKIDEESLQEALDFDENIDLLIRTGGEKRVSNFLLWQIAYAELHFSPTMWPDFSTKELEEIMLKYKKIDRRFGKL